MMFTGLCHPGYWGSFGTFGASGWLGLILSLVFWGGLIAILALLVIRASPRTRVQATNASYATGQLTAMEILQSQYARGEISREQYELRKRDPG